MKRLLLTSVALFALTGAASAATINVLFENPRNNAVPVADQFSNVTNFGVGANNRIATGGVFDGITVTSVDGGSAQSGVFAGNLPPGVVNLEASVFGDFNSTRGYLAAGGGGGSVNLASAGNLTDLFILWGTVDRGSVRNVITTNGGDVITGEQMWNAMSPFAQSFGDGNVNVWAHITGLNPYNSATFSDGAANSFEFTVQAAAVPGPVLGAGLPGLIAGAMGLFGFNRYRRKRGEGVVA